MPARGHGAGFSVWPNRLDEQHVAELRDSGPMSSDLAKPIIFISYAHADEPKKPRGEEIQWLSFVMSFCVRR